MQELPCAGMEVDSEGEHNSQGEGFQALSGVRVEHRTGTEAHVGHRQHLSDEEEKRTLRSITAGTVSAVVSRAIPTGNDQLI